MAFRSGRRGTVAIEFKDRSPKLSVNRPRSLGATWCSKYNPKYGKRAPRRRTGSLALARGLPRLARWPRLGVDRDLDLVESGGEVVLLDRLAPPDDATEVWVRLDAHPPTVIVILNPDHVRDVDFFARRYNVRAFGPNVFHRGDVPETHLEAVEPAAKLPGGLIALYDGRGRNETPLFLPEQRALVFADALTAPEGQLRVWSTPWHNELVLPALRALLELPFEWVIVSHGEPLHNRAAYERALDLPPWDG